MKSLLILLFSVFISENNFAQSPTIKAQHYIDSIYQAHPNTVGVMVHIESPNQNITWSYAVGYSNKVSKTKLSPNATFLTASNTKTYVAAAILKLVEAKKINLDQPITKLISKHSKQLMLKSGYKTNDIKIRNLLSHTSGIADYANDSYFEFINTHRTYQWTRDEQINLSMTKNKPLSAPGDTFKYADVNYLLLTEIIEKYTKQPFYKAIHSLLYTEKNPMLNTWFVNLQEQPKSCDSLAHQYWEKYPWDSYDLNPSWDLYGGGGIATTTSDIAIFFQELFNYNIIKDKALVQQLYTAVPCKTATNYCLGIRKLNMAGHAAYQHGGFWGTDALYVPDLNASISIVILEKNERAISAEICKAMVEILSLKQ